MRCFVTSPRPGVLILSASFPGTFFFCWPCCLHCHCTTLMCREIISLMWINWYLYVGNITVSLLTWAWLWCISEGQTTAIQVQTFGVLDPPIGSFSWVRKISLGLANRSNFLQRSDQSHRGGKVVYDFCSFGGWVGNECMHQSSRNVLYTHARAHGALTGVVN